MKNSQQHKQTIERGIEMIEAVTERVRTRPESMSRDQALLIIGQLTAQRTQHAAMKTSMRKMGMAAQCSRIITAIDDAIAAVTAHLQGMN